MHVLTEGKAARHPAAGFEVDLGKHSEINVRRFLQNFSQIVNSSIRVKNTRTMMPMLINQTT
jgi:hypothetical protein